MSAPLETLKSVTRRFADHFGCLVQERESDLWELRLPDELRKQFRTERWVLCFHRDLMGADPEAQLVTAGAPVLQRMKEALEREGLVGESVLAPVVPTPAAVPAGITPVHGSLRLVRAEARWRTLARIHFRLSLWGAVRQEEFFPVVLDADTGLPAEALLKKALDKASPQAGAPPVGGLGRLDARTLMENAFQEAEARVMDLVAEMEETQEKAARDEATEADAFFIETLRGESDAERRGQLQEFQASRRKEIQERHQVQAELEPRGAVLFRLPRMHLELALEDGPHRARLEAELDQVEGRLLLPRCRHHAGSQGPTLTRVGLCPDHGLHCEACHWTCATCRRPGCPECAKLDCRDCGRSHCAGCIAQCASCGRRTGKAHLVECSHGCGLTCTACEVRVAGSPCCRRCARKCDCEHGEITRDVAVSSTSKRSYCRKCAARELARCDLHGDLTERSSLVRCPVGGEMACPRCRKDLTGGGSACLTHAAACSCGRVVLTSELGRCGDHASHCPTCRWTCATCGETRCTRCKTTICKHCGGMHCKTCSTSCTTCRTLVGRDHLVPCAGGCGLVCPDCLVEVDGRKHCRSCARRCDCGHNAMLSQATVSCDSGHAYCPACTSTTLFHCASSQRWSEVSQRVLCAGGGEGLRRRAALSLPDERWACLEHSSRCECGQVVITRDLLRCHQHGTSHCPHCSFTCATCRKPKCSRCQASNCRFCEHPHCQDCMVTCSACSQAVAGSHLSLCRNGCGPRCPDCIVTLRHEGGRTGCASCAVPCSRCGAWELREKATPCGFCEGHLCRTCIQEAEACSGCGGRACRTGHHLAGCAGGDLVCLRCAKACHVCSRVTCGHHGALCPDCTLWTCTEHAQECRTCGARVCRSCLDASGHCLPCKNLAPVRSDKVRDWVLSALRKQGVDLSGFAVFKGFPSQRRDLYVFTWLFGREELYSVDKEGRILSARRRGVWGRLCNSATEDIS